MIVHYPRGLHPGVDNDRAYKLEAALWRVGLRSLRPALVVSAAVMLTGGLWVLLVAIPIPVLAYFLFWIFLIFILYEALVVMRILGLEYRREARKIGWFRDSRPRSG